jgi:hypothetical protein
MVGKQPPSPDRASSCLSSCRVSTQAYETLVGNRSRCPVLLCLRPFRCLVGFPGIALIDHRQPFRRIERSLVGSRSDFLYAHFTYDVLALPSA